MRKIIIALFFMFLLAAPSFAESDGDKLRELREQINEYTGRIKELQSQAVTLGNQIAQFDAGISLTELQIEETQERIALLGGRIGQLSDSLNDLSNAFESRVAETYKIARLGGDPLAIIVADDLNLAVSRFHYLQEIQKADRDLLSRLERAQTNYIAQRDELQVLEEELGEKRQVLSAQKSAKADLLRVTKNDEKTFQELLAKARADQASIERALLSVGAKVGEVGRGDVIASVGNTGCSSAPHLHFEAYKNAKVKDGKVVDKDSDDPILSKITDHLINPLDKINSGDFQHPLPGSTITNGFKNPYFLGIHTGVDYAYLHSDRVTRGQPILAADKGVAYLAQDSQLCRGFELNGVGKGIIVDHENGFVSLYWHIP